MATFVTKTIKNFLNPHSRTTALFFIGDNGNATNFFTYSGPPIKNFTTVYAYKTINAQLKIYSWSCDQLGLGLSMGTVCGIYKFAAAGRRYKPGC